jgi:tail-anchored protein insertion receptor
MTGWRSSTRSIVRASTTRYLERKDMSRSLLTYAASKTRSMKGSFDSRINTVRFLAVNGFRVYLQYNYSRQPMYWLPKGWIPWYGEWILAFPYAPRGSVSVQVWQMACGSVLKLIVDAITSGTKLALGKVVESKRRSKQQQAPAMKQAS